MSLEGDQLSLYNISYNEHEEQEGAKSNEIPFFF